MSYDKNKLTIETITNTFGKLFPSQFEFLVLYNLSVNYPSLEIQYAEIKQAILDTSRLPIINTGKDRQVERTFKELLRSFIERVPSKSNRFALTPHAEKIIEIITQRVNNPYLTFPLKDTFEMYFTLSDGIDQDITALQSWFRFGFQNNARQVVTGHLEALKLSVDDAIKSLNDILEADSLSAMQMLEQFAQKFRNLGEKATQIAEAIRMKVDVHYKLRDIVNSYQNVDDGQDKRQIARRIKDDVVSFFEKVDGQLDLINKKMGFAGSKITELQESLRTQSHYKISLRKMLLYLLENSHYDQLSGVTLPEKFPIQGWVQEKFRLRYIRRFDTGFLRKAIPVESKQDTAYEEAHRKDIETELDKQSLIQAHLERLQADLQKKGSISLSEEIFELVDTGPEGLEIGVQTSYEFVRSLPDNYSLDIQNTLETSSDNNFHVWKTTITRNRALGS